MYISETKLRKIVRQELLKEDLYDEPKAFTPVEVGGNEDERVNAILIGHYNNMYYVWPEGAHPVEYSNNLIGPEGNSSNNEKKYHKGRLLKAAALGLGIKPEIVKKTKSIADLKQLIINNKKGNSNYLDKILKKFETGEIYAFHRGNIFDSGPKENFFTDWANATWDTTMEGIAATYGLLNPGAAFIINAIQALKKLVEFDFVGAAVNAISAWATIASLNAGPIHAPILIGLTWINKQKELLKYNAARAGQWALEHGMDVVDFVNTFITAAKNIKENKRICLKWVQDNIIRNAKEIVNHKDSNLSDAIKEKIIKGLDKADTWITELDKGIDTLYDKIIEIANSLSNANQET